MNRLSCALLCCVLGPALAYAHSDDPKLRDREPRFEGVGCQDCPAAGGRAAAGLGGEFDSSGVILRSWLPLAQLDLFFSNASANGNDCWGYVSPAGREYALVGTSEGTAFVEITDPMHTTVIAGISGPSSLWRDIKVYQHYAYAVSEGGGGIQVMDMANIDQGVVTLVNTVLTGGLPDTHNVALNEDSGYLYRTGAAANVGLRIYDLSDPVNPEWVAEWHDRYVHDAQVVTYTSGPYAGREIAFCFGGYNNGGTETGLTILDVTDKSDIFTVIDNPDGHFQYPNNAYSHQGWLSADRQWLFLDDEQDEWNYGLTSTMHILDVSDLEHPAQFTTFTNGNSAITHNLYTAGNRVFAANYRSGLRVFDVANPTAPSEIAYFDTYPNNDNPNFSGLWSNYPYFPSGAIIGSDMQRGLFVWQLEAPPLVGDLDGSGGVDAADLALLLGSWGACGGCLADLNGDGLVDASDLAMLLGNWGA